MLEHSTNGAREQRSAGWKYWLLATDPGQKGGGCAVKNIQSLGGAPEVLADWWPTVLCVEPAMVGQIFSGTVILEWGYAHTNACIRTACCPWFICKPTLEYAAMCNAYANHMQHICKYMHCVSGNMQVCITYADIADIWRKNAKICSHMPSYVVMCMVQADTCMVYARPMQNIWNHIMDYICKDMQSALYALFKQIYHAHICRHMHWQGIWIAYENIFKHMQSCAWNMLKYAVIYRYMHNICKYMHQVCKHRQAYAFYNNKYANIWYYMREYTKIWRNMHDVLKYMQIYALCIQ